MCAYPGCNETSNFQLGIAEYDKFKVEKVIGPICDKHMRSAIENIMIQCAGSTLWVVVCDKNGKILYHSYQADQMGIKAAYGWELHFNENIAESKED